MLVQKAFPCSLSIQAYNHALVSIEGCSIRVFLLLEERRQNWSVAVVVAIDTLADPHIAAGGEEGCEASNFLFLWYWAVKLLPPHPRATTNPQAAQSHNLALSHTPRLHKDSRLYTRRRHHPVFKMPSAVPAGVYGRRIPVGGLPIPAAVDPSAAVCAGNPRLPIPC